MFKSERSHQQFQAFVQAILPQHLIMPRMVILDESELIAKVWYADLTPVREILRPTYCPRGQVPWDPVCLFRSYWIMTQTKFTSITKWVRLLKSRPLYPILSGFYPHDVPGVGTFYDFEDRLLDFDHGDRVKRTRRLRNPNRKPKEEPKKNEKLPPKHPDVINKIASRIIRQEDQPAPELSDALVQQIFKHCFVQPSASLGLLGNVNSLSICGDGTMFSTYAAHNGIKVCDCKENGIYRCDCPRRYSDPSANWGWDSYRARYVFGYANYTLVAADSPYNLPIYSTIVQASRFDGVTFCISLDSARKLYPQFNIGQVILDSAHDNYATYNLLDRWNIIPFIALNRKNKGNFKYEPPITITSEGVPICIGGHPMVYWGPDRQRHRLKWRCPAAVYSNFRCQHFNCTDSSYGRTIYTKPDWDLRTFTPVPRGSPKWKSTMAKRSASERRNSRVKEDYHLVQDRVRSKSRWMIRTIMRDCSLHADAWIKHAKTTPADLVSEIFDLDQAA